VIGVPGAQLRLLEKRVQLNLVDRGPRLGLPFEALQILNPEVRDPDRPGAALFVDPLEGPPGLNEETSVGAGQWIR
jgi:hypothetical protein